MPKPKTIELIFTENGVEVEWWTPEVAKVICGLCPKKDTERCDKIGCLNANPYCG